ncbi:MAG: hypothetical protein K940chlam6_00746 [Chlamydiae bacterium]|nr:hypothetical protein [Chlamydiota bacterium]
MKILNYVDINNKRLFTTGVGAAVGYLVSESWQGAVVGAIKNSTRLFPPTIKTAALGITFFSCAYFATEQFIPKNLSLLAGVAASVLYDKKCFLVFPSLFAWLTPYVSSESLAIISGINLIDAYSRNSTVYKTKITASLIAATCQIFFFTHCIQQGNFKETAVLALYSIPSFVSYRAIMRNWHSGRGSNSTNDSQRQITTFSPTIYRQTFNDSIDDRSGRGSNSTNDSQPQNITRSSTIYRQTFNDPIDERIENLEEGKTLEHYHCPILRGLTKDPVLDPTDLHTVYDKESILQLLANDSRSSITRKPFSADELIPLPAAKEFIKDRLNFPNEPPSKKLQEAAEQEYNQWTELSAQVITSNRQFSDLTKKKIIPPKTLKRIISSLSELSHPHEAEPSPGEHNE